jgi:polyisoprenyl-teichoic acid--peptidoglycan teichoic acid transferase
MKTFEPKKDIAPKISIQELQIPVRTQAERPRKRRRPLRWILFSLFLIIAVLGSVVLAKTIKLTDKIFVGEQTSFSKKIVDFFRGSDGAKLEGEDLGQINILLLGIGGAGHDGGYLADTIILAQIRPDINKMVLSAIPRDYLVNLKQYGYRKINASFAEGYNQNKNFNEGGKLAREAVFEVTGLTIPYFAVVDFTGFEQAVDLLGGVSVDIPKTFTDFTFPDEKDGYIPAVTFKQGLEVMTGRRALMYARSRHAAGGEGSDFARSVRQQLIIQAAKQKITELNLVSDAGKINQLATVLGNHFHTNIQPAELFRLYNLTKDYKSDGVISSNLEPSTKLICPDILEENGAYVLVPCAGYTATDIKKFFSDAFEGPAPVGEQSVIWMADSSNGQTLYTAAEKKLTKAGFVVYKVSYTTKPLEQSVVYAVNERPKTLSLIKDELNARSVTLPPPGINIDKNKVDIILILGGKPPAVESSTTLKQVPETTKNSTPKTPVPVSPIPKQSPLPEEIEE